LTKLLKKEVSMRIWEGNSRWNNREDGINLKSMGNKMKNSEKTDLGRRRTEGKERKGPVNALGVPPRREKETKKRDL